VRTGARAPANARSRPVGKEHEKPQAAIELLDQIAASLLAIHAVFPGQGIVDAERPVFFLKRIQGRPLIRRGLAKHFRQLISIPQFLLLSVPEGKQGRWEGRLSVSPVGRQVHLHG
jgi:hypothetical protein